MIIRRKTAKRSGDFISAGALFLAAVLVLGCDSGRSSGGGEVKQGREEAPRISVLCSFLPLWVFTSNVAAGVEGVEVGVLIPGHQGPHDYQLTPGDMKKISNADLFVINGLRLEEFISDAAIKARQDLVIFEAARAVRPIHVGDEGYWTGGHDHEEHGHEGVNPHAFAGPREAALMVTAIAKELARLDPEKAGSYRENAAAYAARLNALADEFKKVVARAPNKKIVTFHNAFDYLARDTGLELAGVIETVPGQQPSAGELAALAEKIRDSGAVAVFSEPQYSPRVAAVLAEEAGVGLYQLDPGATGEMRSDVYEEIMRQNLETMKKALGVAGE